MARSEENPDYNIFQDAVRNMKNKDGFREVAFSSLVKKINKKDKMSERALLLTDKHLHKLHVKNFKPLRNPIPLQEVNSFLIK